MGPPPPRVDGQAVIEGVMMRTAEAFAVAVRRPTGEVVVRRRRLPPRDNRPWMGQLPLLRGLVATFDGIFLGYLALCFSLAQGGGGNGLATADVGAEALARRPGRTGASTTFVTLVAVTLLAPVGLVLVPASVDALAAQSWLNLSAAGWPRLATLGAQAVSAVAQLSFLPAFVAAAAQLPPLRRLCGYHGAEHKVRGAYAQRLRLTLLNVRRQPARVADCRLQFTASFAAVTTVLFFALSVLLPTVPPPVDVGAAGELILSPAGFWLRMVALIPAVALCHELRRWQTARATAQGAKVVLARSATVREPDPAMLEVALAALHAVLAGEDVEERGDATAATLAWRRLDGAMPMAGPGTRTRRAQRQDPRGRHEAEAACCTN